MNAGEEERAAPPGEGRVVEFPAAGPPALDIALAELDLVYAFVHARVGNRPDAEDVTQQVALKALPRLREGAHAAAIRAYLYATARTVLATFWAGRLGMPVEVLEEDLAEVAGPLAPNALASERVARILNGLPANYRRVLELRFLRGYSLKEAAAEMGTTVGNVKVMQLRALRAAGRDETGG